MELAIGFAGNGVVSVCSFGRHCSRSRVFSHMRCRRRSPGPIQFAGAPAAHLANLTLALEVNDGKPISIF